MHVWKPHWSHQKVDLTRCRSAVHEHGRGVGFYQCTRKGVIEEDGMLWCRQHAPSAERKRHKARQAKWNREARERDLANKRYYAREKITKIAIALFRQETTFDMLEAAVTEYEKLSSPKQRPANTSR